MLTRPADRRILLYMVGVLTLVGLCYGFGRSNHLVTQEFLKRTYTDSQGRTSHYVVFVPRLRPMNEKLPVILFLNGWGENGTDGLRQISNNFGGDLWRMRGYFSFLAVCPQCPYNGSWAPGKPNAKRAFEILDEALIEFGGDPDRVYVTGASAGGQGALELASAHPDRFAAVVPVAVGKAGDPEKLAAEGMPVWSFYNGHDAWKLPESARQFRSTLIEHGSSPLASEFDRGGHNAWDSAYGPPGLYHWLLQQRTSQRKYLPRFELSSPKHVLASWEQRGTATWTEMDDELMVSGFEGEASAQLLSPPFVGSCEFHFDVHLEAMERCRVALMLADDEAKFAEIVVEHPDYGTGGLRDASGSWLTRLDPAGQRAIRIGWNDVRLARQEGRLSLQLNGWSALEMELSMLDGPIRWVLVVAAGDKPIRWRYLRHRNLTDLKAK